MQFVNTITDSFKEVIHIARRVNAIAGDFSIYSLDAALVAPGRPSLLNFTNQQPDLRAGVAFNLYNNVWGTNFPMWYSDDAVSRFQLRWTTKAGHR